MFDLNRAAIAVVIALERTVPPPVILTLRENSINVSLNGREVASIWLPVRSPTGDVEAVKEIAFKALWDIQDVISIETREPWPLFHDSRRNPPLPYCEIRGDSLEMWYGANDGHGPSLQLPRVALETIAIE